MSNERKPQWSNIRKRLLLLDHSEPIAQIKDLYVGTPEEVFITSAKVYLNE